MCLCDPDLIKMASDLTIEIFAFKQLSNSCSEFGEDATRDILKVYGEECMRIDYFSEACDEAFNKAIYCRMVLFAGFYINQSYYQEASSWKSISDYHDYINRFCDKDDLFGHLTICERMFATCAFVRATCLFYNKSSIDVWHYAHSIWAMYFEKFTKRFHNEGGWNELKRVAKTYTSLYDLFYLIELDFSTERYIKVFKEATANFCQFKNAAIYHYCKHKHEGKTRISKMWVKLRTQFFENNVTFPPSIGNSENSFEIEMLLQHLKRICNFSNHDSREAEISKEKIHESIWPTGMTYSKTDNNHEIKTDEEIQIENLGEDLITSKDCIDASEVTSDTDEEINVNKELVKLRREPKDPEIRNFLRMILVLGDKQLNHYVLGDLSHNEESFENSQMQLSKTKEKSTKSKK